MPARKEPVDDRYARGLAVRREVLGREYVDAAIDRADGFTQVFQQLTTEWCWGFAWSRDGLDRRTRSMLNLAMLTALGRLNELALHVRGAVNNGVTPNEIRETLVQATVYCGIPAGLEAFTAAHAVLVELGQLDTEAAKGPT